MWTSDKVSLQDAGGKLAAVSNALAVVAYAYAPDGLDAGYSLTLADGVTFTRTVARDPFRRDLATSVGNAVGDADSTASTIHYYWGKDVSGTLQGAGGIGGLL